MGSDEVSRAEVRIDHHCRFCGKETDTVIIDVPPAGEGDGKLRSLELCGRCRTILIIAIDIDIINRSPLPEHAKKAIASLYQAAVADLVMNAARAIAEHAEAGKKSSGDPSLN